MTIKPFLKAVAALAVSAFALGASANSISFDSSLYEVENGQVTVTVNYDFTQFAMFGGGMDLIYDSSVLSFESFTRAPLPDDAQAPASPDGGLASAGVYSGFGIGTFDFINGMNSAGAVGTFVFNLAGPNASAADAGCGAAFCLVGNAINPLVSLAGSDVTADLLAGATADLAEIPVPAAVWFLLSGLGALLGFGRKSA